MELTNTLMRYRGTDAATQRRPGMRLRATADVDARAGRAPHIAEELWSRRLAAAGAEWSSIHTESWPAFDPALIVADTIELPVQVNGKVRDKVAVAVGLPEAELETIVMSQPKIVANLEGKEVVKVIHVGGRLVNIVAR